MRKKTIKNASAVINELMDKPHYKPLKSLFFCKDFLNSFPPAKQRLIAKIYVKNHILNIITLHPAAYQELNHDDSKTYIKILIKAYGQKYPLSEFALIKELRIFSQRYSFKANKNEEKPPKKPYIELSKGEFKNCFEDEILFEKFEKLRELIKKGSSLA